MTPKFIFRRRLQTVLRSLQRYESGYIYDRVNYYIKLCDPFVLGENAARFSQLSCKRRSAYYFDFQDSISYFDPSSLFQYVFGDVIDIPDHPAFVKSRPIDGENENSVLLKLNKVRHFTFVRDPLTFTEKKDKLVWRGKAGVDSRVNFMRMHFHNPLIDIGQTNPTERDGNPLWQKGYMSIDEQLRFKFILSIEGFDVASNLKWILSSNSLCFMKRPIYETWFMEGRLIPGVHYVLLADDYSDLDEKINYYLEHQQEALEITRQANDYCEQFKNSRRERLISLLVMKHYFELSGQM